MHMLGISETTSSAIFRQQQLPLKSETGSATKRLRISYNALLPVHAPKLQTLQRSTSFVSCLGNHRKCRHKRRKLTVCCYVGIAAVSPVLSATVTATFKLLVLCGLVGSFVRKGLLPSETAGVVSKVSFSLIVPSMLFTRVAQTLVEHADITLLIIPLVSAAQVLIGTGLGMLASQLFVNQRNGRPGWHPRNKAPSAGAIAAAAAAAAGVPQAAIALKTSPGSSSSLPAGAAGVMTVACGFGNSLTLPLVFFATLFCGPQYNRAVGYTALIQIAWYPLLWSLGYSLLRQQGTAQSIGQRRMFVDVLETTTNAKLALLNRVGSSVAVAAQRGVNLGGCFSALHTWVLRCRSVLLRALNPPLVGVFSGVVLGLTPLGALLFDKGGTTASMQLPFELSVLTRMLRCVLEVLEILGGASLAAQGIVLGASLFAGDSSEAPKGQQASAAVPASPSKPSSSSTALTAPITPHVQQPTSQALVIVDTPAVASTVTSYAAPGNNATDATASRSVRWYDEIIPSSPDERAMLATISVVRFLVMPVVGVALVALATAAGWLPKDPICSFALLVQVVMPPAQSLSLMVQLHASTLPLVPLTSRLLLRLYAVAIVPVTAWLSLFVFALKIVITT